MLKKDMRKNEIEEVLEGKGDFVKIDYLNRYLKEAPSLDMKKFAYLKLAEVYMNKNLFADAANMFKNAAVNSIVFREKQENYVKEAKCYIRAGLFENVNVALKNAFSDANESEKSNMFKEIVEYYKKEGERLETYSKSSQAIALFERLIRMKISSEDKFWVKEKLLNLYQKLGKSKEYNMLKSVGNI